LINKQLFMSVAALTGESCVNNYFHENLFQVEK